MATNNHKKALKHIIDMKIYNTEISREFINFVAINYPSVLNAFMDSAIQRANELNIIMFENLTNESCVKNKISGGDLNSIVCQGTIINAIKAFRAIVDNNGGTISLMDAKRTLDEYASRFHDEVGWKKS